MRHWRNSLTFRLIFLFTLVTSVLLIGLGSITLYLTDRHFLELDETYLKDKGMQVFVVPAGELATWQKATESVQTLFIKRTGEAGKQLVEFCKNLK